MNLTQILDDLTVYCESVTGKKCELKLVLPDEVLESFSKSAKPIEKIVLAGGQPNEDYSIKTLWGNGGTIKLLKASMEDNNKNTTDSNIVKPPDEDEVTALVSLAEKPFNEDVVAALVSLAEKTLSKQKNN